MRLCILGAGGLGCVLGGWLADSGVDVTLVARPEHVDAIRSRGLRITGIRGERIITEHLTAVTTADQAHGPFDYMILLVKAKDTDATLAAATPLRESCAVVLSLQNAVDKEQRLQSWIGSDRVIGASTTEAGTIVGPGAVRHVATAPICAYFGEMDGASSVRVNALVEVFNNAGFRSESTSEILHVEWEKFLQIATIATWSVSTMGALGGSMAHGLVTRPAAEHYVQLASELLAVYRAIGFEPKDYFAPFTRFRRFAELSFDEAVDDALLLGEHMRQGGVVGRPSLHDDLLRGHMTEVDATVAPFLDEARKHNCPVPTVTAAYRIIKVLEYWSVIVGGVQPVDLPLPAARGI